MSDVYNVLVAGVGGQGNLVCGRVLAEVAMLENQRPILCDTFGASRRGGSVLTHLRIASIDVGPLVPKGSANLIVGMEPVETLRTAIAYSAQHTDVICNTSPIFSPSVLSGKEKYPDTDDVIEALRDIAGEVHCIDPTLHLQEIGTSKVLNVLMLGFLAGLGYPTFHRDNIALGIEKVVGMSSTNKDAFERGYQEGTKVSSD